MYADSARKVIHNLDNLVPHCNQGQLAKREPFPLDLAIIMIESGGWKVCSWCIGAAGSTNAAIRLIKGLKRADI